MVSTPLPACAMLLARGQLPAQSVRNLDLAPETTFARADADFRVARFKGHGTEHRQPGVHSSGGLFLASLTF